MRLAALFLAISAWAQGPAPRLDAWHIIGPGGGGAMFYPTVSPLDPSRVLVGCDMTGSYLSLDGGESWRMFNLRGRSSFFVFDPVDRDTVYARSIGLFRSTNAGKTWSLVFPAPGTVTGVSNADDHASESLRAGTGFAPRVTALAIDPADSRTLYAAIPEGGVPMLKVSTDRGATWNNSAPLPGAAQKIYIDPKSPKEDRTIYVIGTRAVAARKGGKWATGAELPGGASFRDVSAGFSGGAFVVYGTTGSALFVSEDGGASWTRSSPDPAPGTMQSVGTSLFHADTAYLSYGRMRRPDGTFFGVAKTVDRGKSWNIVWKESLVSAENVSDAWLSPRFGPGWAGAPFNLGVAPTNPEIAYGTDYGRTMRTTDGGRTWKAVYSRRAPGAGYATTGLDVTTNYGVHFDPFNPKRLFITYTDIGLFRSEDGGATWLSSIDGVPRAWWNTTYWVEFDPKVKGRMWGAMSKTHDLPRPKMWRNADPASYDGGISISEDGGVAWRASNEGMGPAATTHVLLDPRSPVDGRVLYAAAFGKGVFKSVDGGKTWVLKNQGIEGRQPFAWRLALSPDRSLYVVVARRTENGSFDNDGDGAVYRSTDGAETWTKLPLPRGVNGPNGLLADPRDPARLYLAVWGRSSKALTAEDGGIYLSTDTGKTWRNVFEAGRHVYDVTIDAKGVLYACGFENSAWRSTDRGATWSRIRGYNFKWGHRVIPDPRDPSKIYVTTFGGSVWHGPAAGDPGAAEDIVTGP